MSTGVEKRFRDEADVNLYQAPIGYIEPAYEERLEINRNQGPIQSLQRDIKSKIFGFLPFKYILRIRRVCKEWSNIINGYGVLGYYDNRPRRLPAYFTVLLSEINGLSDSIKKSRVDIDSVDSKLNKIAATQERVEYVSFASMVASMVAVMFTPPLKNFFAAWAEANQAAYLEEITKLLAEHPGWTKEQAINFLYQQAWKKHMAFNNINYGYHGHP
jgi:hypothetical protein